MTGRSPYGAIITMLVLVAEHVSAQALPNAPDETVPVANAQAHVGVRSPVLSGPKASRRRGNGDGSSRRGVLLRSNVALVAARVGGFDVEHPEYAGLSGFRFATVNQISLGYGWRKDFAPTIDGFRLVMPYYPAHGDPAKFELRVEEEVLGLGLGTTSYYAPLSMHWGQTMGYAMGRLGGGLLDAPKYKGFGGLFFAGYEFMRSRRIAIVLYGQWFNALLFDGKNRLITQALGASFGVTYW